MGRLTVRYARTGTTVLISGVLLASACAVAVRRETTPASPRQGQTPSRLVGVVVRHDASCRQHDEALRKCAAVASLAGETVEILAESETVGPVRVTYSQGRAVYRGTLLYAGPPEALPDLLRGVLVRNGWVTEHVGSLRRTAAYRGKSGASAGFRLEAKFKANDGRHSLFVPVEVVMTGPR